MVGPSLKKYTSVEERIKAEKAAQEAAASAAESSRLDLIGQISNFFASADKDGDGRVTLEEFQSVMADPSMSHCIMKLRLPVAMSAAELFDYLDADGSGAITAHELVNGCSRFAGDTQRLTQKILSKR